MTEAWRHELDQNRESREAGGMLVAVQVREYNSLTAGDFFGFRFFVVEKMERYPLIIKKMDEAWFCV